MRGSLILRSALTPNVALRAISDSDNDNLRLWKNANRHSFFFQEIITPEMQAHWFEQYLARPGDFMFVVLREADPVGCMGFRLLDDTADIYNVIRGSDRTRRSGTMSRALSLMCSYILSEFDLQIGLKVLKANPAVEWYRKNGFLLRADRATWLELVLDLNRFAPVQFEKVT